MATSADYLRRVSVTPFIEDEIRAVYKQLPTYRATAEGETIDSVDVRELCNKLKWSRSEAQHKMYKQYWDTHFGGTAPLKAMIPILETIHTKGPYLRTFITACDKNGDGFISKEEFQLFLGIFELHCGCGTEKKSYEKFVAEADVDADGKVSIEEAIDWAQKEIANE